MPGGTDYRERKPISRLAPYVECLWTHGSRIPVRVLPDTCVDLVFSRQTGLRVVGSMTRAMVLEPASEAFVGIRLRAGAARSLLELPVGEIRDEAIPLQNLWGKHGRAIEELMCEAASAEDGMRVLEAALVPLRPLSSFQNAIGYLASNGGRVRLEDIARGTGLGIRQFRRRCIEETGLSPRHLARIGRFRNACSHIVQSARVDWADLASEFGYYDQAQLINEFREFSGLAPGAYLRQRGT